MAYWQATLSHDPRTQNGALLTDGETVFSLGRNHVPGVHGPELDAILADRDEKNARVVHAEAAAIVEAARLGVRTEGLTMVCPWAACLACAGLIHAAGIVRLVTHGPRMEMTHGPWRSRVDTSAIWLRDAGVEVVVYGDAIPEAPMILVNGQEWQP